MRLSEDLLFLPSASTAAVPGRERLCERCAAKRATHKLHMRFERCQGSRVSFRDLTDGRAQFREFTFANAGKINRSWSGRQQRWFWSIGAPSNWALGMA